MLVGNDKLEGLIFPFTSQKTVFPFLDLRGHVFNNGESAANAGIGLRIAPSTIDVLFGANVYYDYRFIRSGASFNQMGCGVELLGNRLDFRLNGYIPINTHKTLHTDLYDDYTDGYYILHKKYGSSMRGGNAELGCSFIKSKIVDLYSAIGPYYFTDHFLRNRHAFGGQFRLALTLAKYLSLEGLVTRDSLFKTRAQAQATLSLPIGCKKEQTNKDKRLSQPIKRYEIIVLDNVNQWKWNY